MYANILRARGFEHLGSRGCRVLHHGFLVVPLRHRKMQSGDAPGVLQFRIDRHEIVIPGKTFSESADRDTIRAGDHRLLVSSPETFCIEVELRAGAALVAIAANESRMPGAIYRIAEADDIDTVCPSRTI